MLTLYHIRWLFACRRGCDIIYMDGVLLVGKVKGDKGKRENDEVGGFELCEFCLVESDYSFIEEKVIFIEKLPSLRHNQVN